MIPPMFELTDPAIHYASAKGRGVVFGAGQAKKGRERKFVFTPIIATKFAKCFTSLLATKSGIVTGAKQALGSLISGRVS